MGANMRFSLVGLFEHKLDYSRPNRFLINILTLSDRIACSLQNGIKNLYVEHYVGAIGKRANLYTMKKDVFKRIHGSFGRRRLTFLNCRNSICLNASLGQHAPALFIASIATYN